MVIKSITGIVQKQQDRSYSLDPCTRIHVELIFTGLTENECYLSLLSTTDLAEVMCLPLYRILYECNF